MFFCYCVFDFFSTKRNRPSGTKLFWLTRLVFALSPCSPLNSVRFARFLCVLANLVGTGHFAGNGIVPAAGSAAIRTTAAHKPASTVAASPYTTGHRCPLVA